ncbi:MAG TPA: hypothetical protein DDW78_04335 [Treponema sp.]|nr:hypothetical protein [Treponema sp.]
MRGRGAKAAALVARRTCNAVSGHALFSVAPFPPHAVPLIAAALVQKDCCGYNGKSWRRKKDAAKELLQWVGKT